MSKPISLFAVLGLAVGLAAPAGAGEAPPPVGTSAGVAAATAVPLEGGVPDWFTPDVEAAVLAADGVPVAAPNDAPLPGTVGIRPGSWMVAPSGCTMNFVFTKGDALGIGTAGHCASTNDDVVLLTLAPGAQNPVLVDIGDVLVSRDHDIGDDFALVEVKPELSEWVSPTTAVVAGPCGAYTASEPAGVLHYGHGVGIGTGGTPRGGLGLYFEDDAFFFTSAGVFGDSGSPVRVVEGPAAGNLTHIVVDTRRPGATLAGTRISKMLQIAGGWSLADSPLCGVVSGGDTSDPSQPDPEPARGQGKRKDAERRGHGRTADPSSSG